MRNRSLPAAILFVLGLSSSASAQFMTFTDRAAFLAAASGAGFTSTTEDLSADPGDPFTITDTHGSVTLDITLGAYNAGDGNILHTGFADAATLVSTGITGSVRGFGYSQVGNGGNGSLAVNGLAPVGRVGDGFLGVLATDGTEITVIDQLEGRQAGFVGSTLDDIVVVSGAATAVPEPGGVALLTAGLAVAVLGRRRREEAL